MDSGIRPCNSYSIRAHQKNGSWIANVTNWKRKKKRDASNMLENLIEFGDTQSRSERRGMGK